MLSEYSSMDDFVSHGKMEFKILVVNCEFLYQCKMLLISNSQALFTVMCNKVSNIAKF